MVKEVFNDEERVIGDSYTIEVQRRRQLRCSYNFTESRGLRETNSPVVASWLVQDLISDERNVAFDMPESFICKYIIHLHVMHVVPLCH